MVGSCLQTLLPKPSRSLAESRLGMHEWACGVGSGPQSSTRCLTSTQPDTPKTPAFDPGLAEAMAGRLAIDASVKLVALSLEAAANNSGACPDHRSAWLPGRHASRHSVPEPGCLEAAAPATPNWPSHPIYATRRARANVHWDLVATLHPRTPALGLASGGATSCYSPAPLGMTTHIGFPR